MARDSLTRLSDLSGYRVVDEDPDPRGWDVVTPEGQRIGRVDELIVDRDAEQARYLDVHLERGDEHRHVLIPTEAVRIGEEERQRRQVAVAAGADHLASVTPYRGLPLTREQEAEYQACLPAERGAGGLRGTRIHRGGEDHD